MLQDLIVNGVILISSIYISLSKHKISVLFTSAVICCTGYIQHLRFRASKDLKHLISLQNELLAMCKKSLKILRHVLKIKLSFKTHVQQFFHFLGEKLQYLQSLTETLLSFMENISYIYYECSLLIAKIMPSDIVNGELFTKFERNTFCAFGEINYQILKKSYHTYLLVQSEMLHLLAIAYDRNTWISSCQKIPETELTYIIYILTKKLAVYKVKLSKILYDYDTCKAEPIRYKVRDIAKWHDPSVQLDLASHKLQLAYNQVFLIFKNIDDCISQESGINDKTAEILMQKLDKTFKEFNIAKNLAEFTILLIAKSGFNNLRGNKPKINHTKIDENSDLSVIFNSDPEILDEVFEEYIKEEYLKPLHEEKDEYSLKQYKLDNLLVKNFMSELKEVLLDKRKSMSERESKALQRIYKNISEDTTLNNENNICKNYQFIPVPPPMPPYYLWLTSSKNITLNANCEKIASSNCKVANGSLSIQKDIDKLNEECNSVEPLRYKSISNISLTETHDEEDKETVSYLPQILLQTQASQYIMKLPCSFMQEETFIGNGENFEDEIVDNPNNDDKNSENSQLNNPF
ncbi:uncharacterized protein LOC116846180 isoform X2 [Odontomachus brunneus]|nr:uncharacterized protein LOC116846180 isoform X2 [Odontomachus brunneus]XP_032675603.1 uncharacterized protein LOC116846180 isoform X2 [Odontomachus brunneus]XP_032675604.1 uncharacterized protein LOC116846180 isoform X2 [Odontomachus brunneus]